MILVDKFVLFIDAIQNLRILYRIAGNFRMVQNFALFADGLATVKVRTAKVKMCVLRVVSTQRTSDN